MKSEPTHLSLPQYDTNTDRAAALADRAHEYVYTTYHTIPICQEVYDRDYAGSEWLEKVVLALNENRQNLEQFLQTTTFGKFEHALPHSPTLGKQLTEKDFETLFDYFLPEMGLILDGNDRPNTIEDNRTVFTKQPLPDIANVAMEDWVFARMFVAGANPMVLRRLDRPDPMFELTNDMLRQSTGFSDDDVNTAIASGRVYIASYELLEGLATGKHPHQAKFVTEPRAVLAVPTSGSLVAIAIQARNPQTGETQTVTPKDGWAWEMAKMSVTVVHHIHHELIAHLLNTHLTMEGFVIATRRCLSERHPLYHLLAPHLAGTLPINKAAVTQLLGPGGPVERVLTFNSESILALVAKERKALRFDKLAVPYDLTNRGLDDRDCLLDHPYRNDAIRIWGAIHNWVSGYVNHFYTNDADINQDSELQNWVSELTAADKCGLQGIGQNEAIADRPTLIDVLTTVIYTGSARHAAVNFAQRTDMAYTPAGNASQYAPFPSEISLSGRATKKDLLDMLPPIDIVLRAQQVLTFLGDVYGTQLGRYGFDYFSEPAVKLLGLRFQAELLQIERDIEARNKHMRLPYIHLIPSRIPQSTNI